MDYVFETCCILHNMILIHDGLDRLWEDVGSWNSINPAAEGVQQVFPGDDPAGAEYIPKFKDITDGWETLIAIDSVPADRRQIYLNDYHQEFIALRDILATLLGEQHKAGRLKWPKHRKDILDQRHNEQPRQNFPPGRGR